MARVSEKTTLYAWLTASVVLHAVLCPISGAAFSMSLSVQGSGQDDAEEYAEAGLQLAQAGNLPGAEADLRKAVGLAPGDAEILRELATVLAMEKKFDESTAYFQRALKVDPNDLVARRYLAANLWQMHRYGEARRNLRIVLSANPKDPDALLLLGMVSENTKDYATAVKTLASVPTLVRAQPESVAALARSYYHIGKTEEAREWLEELQNHPAGIQAVLVGAEIADEMGDYQTAEAFLTTASEQFSNRVDLQYRLALVKFHEQRFDESARILQQLLQSGHKTSEIHRLLASCLRAQKRDDEAIQSLREAIELEPESESSYLDLASMLLAEKRISPALELAQRMTKAFPDSSRVFVSRGSVELGAGAYTDAVNSFGRAAQLEPGNTEAIVGLARALANAGMMVRATTTLESAIGRFPRKARLELELAQLLLKQAETGNESIQPRAEQLLKSAVVHDSTLAEAHYELGQLALQHGDFSTALLHLQKASTLEPTSAKTHYALSRAYRSLGRKDEAAREASLFDKSQQ